IRAGEQGIEKIVDRAAQGVTHIPLEAKDVGVVLLGVVHGAGMHQAVASTRSIRRTVISSGKVASGLTPRCASTPSRSRGAVRAAAARADSRDSMLPGNNSSMPSDISVRQKCGGSDKCSLWYSAKSNKPTGTLRSAMKRT